MQIATMKADTFSNTTPHGPRTPTLVFPDVLHATLLTRNSIVYFSNGIQTLILTFMFGSIHKTANQIIIGRANFVLPLAFSPNFNAVLRQPTNIFNKINEYLC